MDFNDAQLKASPTYGPEQPIKIVSPVAPVAASSATAAASAPAGSTPSGTTASGSVAAQASSSGARPAR
jgi:hypothetical protein